MDKFLHDLGWKQVDWNKDVYTLNRMLLWLPSGRNETIITAVNNYSEVYFKGIIDSDEELQFVTNILTKTD